MIDLRKSNVTEEEVKKDIWKEVKTAEIIMMKELRGDKMIEEEILEKNNMKEEIMLIDIIEEKLKEENILTITEIMREEGMMMEAEIMTEEGMMIEVTVGILQEGVLTLQEKEAEPEVSTKEWK